MADHNQSLPLHEVMIVAPIGPWGGPTRVYRGIRIEEHTKGFLFAMFFEGHPMDKVTMGNWENMIPLIDSWMDQGELPKPYQFTRKRN